MTTPQDDRPSRYEVVARARNEINGVREEPATITHEEHEARLAGRVDLPDDGQAHSYDDGVAERQRLLDRAERQIMAERDEPDAKDLADRLEHDHPDKSALRWERQVHDANLRSIEGKAEDDRMRAHAATPQGRYEAAMAEADRDRRERADPDTARLVENRDREAAAGLFDEADSMQRLIDSMREAREGREFFEPHRAQGRTQGRSWARIADRDYRGGEDRLERVRPSREGRQR